MPADTVASSIDAETGIARSHVVCSPKEDYLAVITAYLPSEDEWDSDLRTRKTT